MRAFDRPTRRTEAESSAPSPDGDCDTGCEVGDAQEKVTRRLGLNRVLAAALGKEPEPVNIGGFVVEEKVGAGGMGEVYRARDSGSGRHVAVKLVGCDSDTDASRFFREAKILADLRHPAIVGYVAHGETTKGEFYLAMEWLDGHDLAEHLRRRSLSVDEAVRLAVRVADGLSEAHARGVVHRDLKPANIFLRGGRLEDAKLLDFGVAALVDMTHMTRQGDLLGTASYMAPEQAADPHVGPSADVYALGSIIFEALTGAALFQGKTFQAVATKILFGVAPRVRERCPHVPAALDDLVARMLAKDPALRPRDGAALAAELAALGEIGEILAGR